MNLERIIFDSKHFLKDFIGFYPKNSSFFIHRDWNTFLKKNNFLLNAEGVYIPKKLEAHINEASPFFMSNFMHEYFGHGVFYEYSLIGRNIVDLIKRKDKKVLSYFRENYALIEGFALWLEDKIMKYFNNGLLFDLKLDRLGSSAKDTFVKAESFYNTFGILPFLNFFSFPKKYNKKNIISLVDVLLDKKILKNPKLIIFYGSKKPFSDIDLFVVSDYDYNYYDGFLDLYVVSEETFHNSLNNLDISVLDPLFSGSLVYGNIDLLNHYKQLIFNTPISQNAIKYNYEMSEKQKIFLKQNHSLSERDVKVAESYAVSYFLNALSLSNGKKIYTLKQMKENNSFSKFFK